MSIFYKNTNFTYNIVIDDVNYEIEVVRKNQKGLYLKYKDGELKVSAPLFLSKEKIISFIESNAYKLVNRCKRKRRFIEPPIGDDYIFIFGEKENIDKNIDYKKILYEYLQYSVRHYEKEMGIKIPYNIKIRKMKTRYASNSLKTHSLTFQMNLIHYSKEIIDSIVVHELAHEFYRNHQKRFYQCVEKYFPNYKEVNLKLKKGLYK